MAMVRWAAFTRRDTFTLNEAALVDGQDRYGVLLLSGKLINVFPGTLD